MSRKPLSKRVRYAILERDGYRCRYCGADATESRLHVDHRHPVAKGGGDGFENLITACADCNLGKAALIPTAIIEDQRGHAGAFHVVSAAAKKFGLLLSANIEQIGDFCRMCGEPDDFMEILALLEAAPGWAEFREAMYEWGGYPSKEQWAAWAEEDRKGAE